MGVDAQPDASGAVEPRVGGRPKCLRGSGADGVVPPPRGLSAIASGADVASVSQVRLLRPGPLPRRGPHTPLKSEEPDEPDSNPRPLRCSRGFDGQCGVLDGVQQIPSGALSGSAADAIDDCQAMVRKNLGVGVQEHLGAVAEYVSNRPQFTQIVGAGDHVCRRRVP